MNKILLYFSLKYNGDFNKIYKAIKDKELVSKNLLENIESKIKSKYVTLVDKEYPDCLKHIANPPFVLFYYGDFSLLSNNDKLAIIGKRENSEYGKIMCEKIIKELDKKCCIVSGLAKGIDSIAHQNAIDYNLKTIAVLGSGIDNCYPISNKYLYEIIKNEGLIISEYPNFVNANPQNFLIRNRIIAAISNNILVIEASYKSGTMNTVAYGLEFGKEIFAIPYLAISNSGCNYLIKQGAKLVEKAKDIYE